MRVFSIVQISNRHKENFSICCKCHYYFGQDRGIIKLSNLIETRYFYD